MIHLRKILHFSLLVVITLPLYHCQGQAKEAKTSDKNYVYKDGDPSGIGKWYMGREIAHVMGFQGMDWLERSNREEEENTTKLLRDMAIEPGDTIADIGAGSGYHVFKMAPHGQEWIGVCRRYSR